MEPSIQYALKDIYQSSATAENYKRVKAEYQEALAAFKLKERTGSATLPSNIPAGVQELFNKVF